MERNAKVNVALVYGSVLALAGAMYGLHYIEYHERAMTAAELFDHAQDRNVVVLHDNGRAFGSGFFVSPRRILTANHVVYDIEDGTVIINTEKGLTVETDIIYNDADRDIAVLEVRADEDFTFYSFGSNARDSRGLHIYGHPLSSTRDILANATYAGNRVTPTTTYTVLHGFSAGGMSGGPVVDDRGRVVGMTVARLMEGIRPTPLVSIVNVEDLIDALGECDNPPHEVSVDIALGAN